MLKGCSWGNIDYQLQPRVLDAEERIEIVVNTATA